MGLNDKMSALANAIRTKTGANGSLSIDGMTQAVNNYTPPKVEPRTLDVVGVGEMNITGLSNSYLTKYLNSTINLQSERVQQLVKMNESNDVVAIVELSLRDPDYAGIQLDMFGVSQFVTQWPVALMLPRGTVKSTGGITINTKYMSKVVFCRTEKSWVMAVRK